MNCCNSNARRFRAGVCLALAALMGLAPLPLEAKKKPGRDRLVEALDLLNQAKEASNPIPLLTNAKAEVEGTLLPHKDAERDKAVKLIGEAIDASLNGGNKKAAIERAIASVRALSGVKTKKKK